MRKLVNEATLLEHVDLSRRALQDLRSRRVIPYVKVGKKTILYDLIEVLRALERFERKAAE